MSEDEKREEQGRPDKDRPVTEAARDRRLALGKPDPVVVRELALIEAGKE